MYKAIRKSDNKIIALKVVGYDEDNETYQEFRALKLLSLYGCHLNIVCYYGHYIDKTESNWKVLIELEYIEGQTLRKFISKYSNDVGKVHNYLLSILKDLIKGIIYICRVRV